MPPPLQAGTVVQGRVARIESYGCFMDLKFQHGKRGLIHISQLRSSADSGAFVERVEDVVQLGQELYVYIVEITPGDRPGGSERIRLSLKGVNQETGEYDPAVAAAPRDDHRGGGGEGGPPRGGGGGKHAPVPRHLERRAEDRRHRFAQSAVASWRGNDNDDNGQKRRQQPQPAGAAVLRLLWSSSPEPAAAPAAVPPKKASSTQ